MPDFARLPRLLAALGLMIPLLGTAQAPAMSDAERARRDAEKVFGFIKFQTVKPKPAAEPEKPRKPAAPIAPRPISPARQTETAAAPETARTTTSAPATSTPPQAVAIVRTPPPTEAAPLPEPRQMNASFSATPINAVPAPAAPLAAAPEPEADEPEEVPLQLQRFVEPVLPRLTRDALESGSRDVIVTVRFTVEANGTVSKAEALAEAPRRFARPATDAVLQWQFAPLPQARTVDVEIAFRRG